MVVFGLEGFYISDLQAGGSSMENPNCFVPCSWFRLILSDQSTVLGSVGFGKNILGNQYLLYLYCGLDSWNLCEDLLFPRKQFCIWTLPGRVGCISQPVTDWPDCVLQVKLWQHITPLGLTLTRLVHSWEGFFFLYQALGDCQHWTCKLTSSFFLFRPEMTFSWRQTHLKSHLGLCNHCLYRSLQL